MTCAIACALSDTSGTPLNWQGVTLMVVAITCVLGLLVYCYARILRGPPKK